LKEKLGYAFSFPWKKFGNTTIDLANRLGNLDTPR
jgi:hypothetical protein